MKAAILLLTVVASVASAAETPAKPGEKADKPVVLVTAFGPFMNRGVNGSSTLAKRLEGTEIGGATIRTAVLTVKWGEPQAQLPKLLADIKPNLMLGLGEGYPKRIVFERVGHNVADGPDNDQKGPPSPTLEAAGPAERKTRLRFDATWFTSSPLPVNESDNAGAYLCNCWLYTALAQPLAQVGFVHVPPQGDTPDEAYVAASLPAIKTLIAKNLE